MLINNNRHDYLQKDIKLLDDECKQTVVKILDNFKDTAY